MMNKGEPFSISCAFQSNQDLLRHLLDILYTARSVDHLKIIYAEKSRQLLSVDLTRLCLLKSRDLRLWVHGGALDN
jgi:hypothetical protein